MIERYKNIYEHSAFPLDKIRGLIRDLREEDSRVSRDERQERIAALEELRNERLKREER